MTPCQPGKLAPAKDADHKKPIQHYVMQPGTAWHLTPAGREEVKITAEQAKRAVPTFCLIWHSHGVAAEFRIGDALYAQPTQAIIPPKAKRTRAVDVSPQESAPPATERPARGKPRARVKAPLSLDW